MTSKCPLKAVPYSGNGIFYMPGLSFWSSTQ